MKLKFFKLLTMMMVFGSFSVFSSSAFSWGYDGHRIAANIASGLLTQQTRVKVAELLKGSSLADVATYLDEARLSLKHQIPGSDKWHYNNLPICTSVSIEKNCPHGDCASVRIEQMKKILSNRNSDQESRIFALKALVHLIADIHQPLHAADNFDRGGNDVMIGSRNLHSEWDSGIVKKLFKRQSLEDYSNGLLVKYRQQIPALQNDNVNSWLMESHELAIRAAYGSLPGFACGQGRIAFTKLPDSYYTTALPIAESQLVKAGARIAWVLNQTFSK